MASQDGHPEELRIVILGGSGSGKSTIGNKILAKRAFTTRQSQNPTTLTCHTERGEFEGTPVSVVDTPGTIRPNSTEMSKCISYCAPGPHAFLLVIPLEKITDVEQEVKNLLQTFGKEASRYTIVLFTRGDELPDGVTTEELILQNPLSSGVRYHVFNNRDGDPSHVRYHVFNNRDEDPSQVRELLEKIKRMVQRNGGSYCIKVKDWKNKYLYPFTNAVAFGGSFGAVSGRTGGGVLVAVVGSVIGVTAARVRGSRAVNVAVVVVAAAVIALAVAGAGFVAVAGLENFSAAVAAAFGVVSVANLHCSTSRPVAVAVVLTLTLAVAAGICQAAAFAVTVVVARRLAIPEDVGLYAFYGLAVSVFIAGAGANAVAADMGVVDAMVEGVVAGAGIAAIAAFAINVGARGEAAAFGEFDDAQIRIELLGIFGGAAVGAGLCAAVGEHADGPGVADYGDLPFADLAVWIGVATILLAACAIVCEAASAIDKIAGIAIVVGVSAGSAFGAAAGYCFHNNTLRPVVSWLLATFTSSSSNMTMPQ